jgi:hypothetical protein
MSVARSAFRRSGIAAEQANAPDRPQLASHVHCVGRRVIGGVRRLPDVRGATGAVSLAIRSVAERFIFKTGGIQ